VWKRALLQIGKQNSQKMDNETYSAFLHSFISFRDSAERDNEIVRALMDLPNDHSGGNNEQQQSESRKALNAPGAGHVTDYSASEEGSGSPVATTTTHQGGGQDATAKVSPVATLTDPFEQQSESDDESIVSDVAIYWASEGGSGSSIATTTTHQGGGQGAAAQVSPAATTIKSRQGIVLYAGEVLEKDFVVNENGRSSFPGHVLTRSKILEYLSTSQFDDDREMSSRIKADAPRLMDHIKKCAVLQLKDNGRDPRLLYKFKDIRVDGPHAIYYDLLPETFAAYVVCVRRECRGPLYHFEQQSKSHKASNAPGAGHVTDFSSNDSGIDSPDSATMTHQGGRRQGATAKVSPVATLNVPLEQHSESGDESNVGKVREYCASEGGSGSPVAATLTHRGGQGGAQVSPVAATIKSRQGIAKAFLLKKDVLEKDFVVNENGRSYFPGHVLTRSKTLEYLSTTQFDNDRKMSSRIKADAPRLMDHIKTCAVLLIKGNGRDPRLLFKDDNNSNGPAIYIEAEPEHFADYVMSVRKEWRSKKGKAWNDSEASTSSFIRSQAKYLPQEEATRTDPVPATSTGERTSLAVMAKKFLDQVKKDDVEREYWQPVTLLENLLKGFTEQNFNPAFALPYDDAIKTPMLECMYSGFEGTFQKMFQVYEGQKANKRRIDDNPTPDGRGNDSNGPSSGIGSSKDKSSSPDSKPRPSNQTRKRARGKAPGKGNQGNKQACASKEE
jgi:uncharacterized spore protein YtfJ